MFSPPVHCLPTRDTPLGVWRVLGEIVTQNMFTIQNEYFHSFLYLPHSIPMPSISAAIAVAALLRDKESDD